MKQLLLITLITLSLVGCDAIKIIPLSDVPIPTPTPGYPGANYPANVPERIWAGTITLDAPIVPMGWSTQISWGEAVTEWDIPNNEAGWHINTLGPGDGGNIVISGHNNSMGGRVFAQVESLSIGDNVTLQDYQGRVYTYKVTERNIVSALFATSADEAYLQQVMQPTTSEQLTLITCWPSWSNTHRLVVIAKPLP